MKHFVIFTFIFSLINTAHSQIISQFTWDSNPLTNAVIGPNATSVAGNSTSSGNGVGGTNGIKAGTVNNVNINLIIPTASGVFDVNGIDISIDYQREESSGNFFNRGNSLIIKGASSFSVKYRVDNGSGGFMTISSGNAYNIPYDDTYRNYRFYYLPETGYGTLLVDGIEVWSHDGPDMRNMYWTGAGDITIGSGMDGSGRNKTFFDNLIIGNINLSPLPIKLTLFNLAPIENKKAKINWSTASETNNDYFTVERSKDGIEWREINITKGAGNSSELLNYQIIDTKPYSGLSYYRLKQTDFDGHYTYSSIEKIDFTTHLNSQINIYPNPSNQFITIDSKDVLEPFTIYNILGENIMNKISINSTSNYSQIIDLSNLNQGVYFLRTSTTVKKIYKI